MKSRLGVPGFILLAGLLVLSLLLAACEEQPPAGPGDEQLATPAEEAEEAALPDEQAGGEVDAEGSPERQTFIPNTTQVLPPEVTETYLTSIADDGATITFAEGVQQFIDLSVDSVLAVEPSAEAPNGLLRRVVQVTRHDGQIQLQTVQATLEEAIETGFAEAHITLTPADVRESTLSDGVRYIASRRTALADKFFLKIDKSLGTGVKVKGEVTVQPSFRFAAAFDKGTLKHLTIKNTTTQTGRLELISTVASVSFDQRLSIASKTFKPIAVFIGPFPIWLTPRMNVYVGVDGQLTTQMTAAVNQDVTFETGFVYANGQVNLINNATGVAVQFDHPTFSAGATARTYVRPQLDLLIYGRVGPYVAADAYVKLEAGPTRTPLWEITGGVRGVAGVKVKIVSSALAGYEATLFERTWPIATAPVVQRIVFTSDRSGMSAIYLMSADGTDLQCLTNNPAGDELPAWSPDGARIAFTSYSLQNGWGQIYLMNADGSAQAALTGGASHKWDAAWSPDGMRLSFDSDESGDGEIYVIRADGTGQLNLTNHPAFDGVPAWSPDGTRIAFQSDRDGPWRLYVMNADGTQQTPLLTSQGRYDDMQPAWSPDGNQLAFISTRDGNWEIYTVNVDGTGLKRLTAHPAADWKPSWSLDGARIAFASERDGNLEIYIINADGTGLTNLTNDPANDTFPSWQPAP